MVISLTEVKREWVYFLRNSDIFTISQRGVTTDTDTGTFSSDSDHLINVSNIKNVRSIVVASVTLTYGYDYRVDVDFDDSGTIKTKIFFTSAQTGAYTITYDYGTDKIYPDFPRTDLSIGSFPRIGTDIIEIPTEAGGFGGVNRSNVLLTTIVYDVNTDNIAGYIDAIRTAVFNNRSSFFYVGKFIQLSSIGPVIQAPRDEGKDKVMQRNIDVEGFFLYEQ